MTTCLLVHSLLLLGRVFAHSASGMVQFTARHGVTLNVKFVFVHMQRWSVGLHVLAANALARHCCWASLAACDVKVEPEEYLQRTPESLEQCCLTAVRTIHRTTKVYIEQVACAFDPCRRSRSGGATPCNRSDAIGSCVGKAKEARQEYSGKRGE